MSSNFVKPVQCPECSGGRGSDGCLQHASSCAIEVADQEVLTSDRARLQTAGYEGYQRPIAEAERAKLSLDGNTVRDEALVTVSTLWVNGRVYSPRHVRRDWTDAVL